MAFIKREPNEPPKQVEVVRRAEPVRAPKHHVLEQVRKPVPARRLIRAADMIPDLDRDERAVVVLEHQNSEPIGERQFGDREKRRDGRR